MIRVRDVEAGYGRINVLKRVSLDVAAGEIVCVVGANGAGKSTLLRCIQGLLPASAGSIEFDGEDVIRLGVERIVQNGLCLVPETRELFPDMSLVDNLFLGAYIHRKEADAARKREEAMQRVFAIFPALRERRKVRAANLSGGEQQMLAIGRALMARPRALMLDEPSLGLAPLLVVQIFEAVAELRRNGLAILLVEQNVRAALTLASRAYVMETGAIVAQGPSATLVSNEKVKNAYLGQARPRRRVATVNKGI